MKFCTKCKQFVPLDEFQRDSSKKDGRYSSCKECNREAREKYNNAHRKEAIERVRAWVIKNPEKKRRNAKKWRDNNKEKHRECCKRWVENNSERIKENSRRWASENKDRRREQVRKWRKENPEKNNQNTRRRHAREKGALGSHTAQEWEEKKADYGGLCAYCGKPGKMTEDHVVPLSRGGSDYIENILPACLSCNSAKNDTPVDEWIKRRNIRIA